MRTYPDMKITGRIKDGQKTVGYVVVDTTGLPKKLKSKTVLELAKGNRFINASAYTRDGTWYLKGENGENLSALPIVPFHRKNKNAVDSNNSALTASKSSTYIGGQRINNMNIM